MSNAKPQKHKKSGGNVSQPQQQMLAYPDVSEKCLKHSNGFPEKYATAHNEEPIELTMSDLSDEMSVYAEVARYAHLTAVELLESTEAVVRKHDDFGRTSMATNDGASNNIERIFTDVAYRYGVVAELANIPVIFEDYIDIGEKLTYYKFNASVYASMLNATVTVLNQRVSYYSETWDDEMGKYNRFVSLVRQYDPSYTPPGLRYDRPKELSLPQPKASGGCYVATAVYGSYDCPEVWTLRRFRDTTLASTWYGRAFIRTYYAISPTLVRWFGDKEWFNRMFKPSLDRLVDKLQQEGFDSTPYEDQ